MIKFTFSFIMAIVLGGTSFFLYSSTMGMTITVAILLIILGSAQCMSTYFCYISLIRNRSQGRKFGLLFLIMAMLGLVFLVIGTVLQRGEVATQWMETMPNSGDMPPVPLQVVATLLATVLGFGMVTTGILCLLWSRIGLRSSP